MKLDILDIDAQYPIRVEILNNRYHILDGSHRVIALRNAGYKEAEILIKEN
ncbi:ParB N-terminal domain-containing protein [uncultured Clostridium sp.]|uniref:ParB N-terminal domain-containing protein n=1 Tax=uncultured Clostridium sp. TaxID=59620 RepID=UPI00345D5CC7